MSLKKAMIIGVLATLPAAAFAAGENNIGTCGWGAKLFDGQSGIAPQVLAVTTNGTSGNQTFGITTGTSGCTPNGTVHSSWKTAMFIDGNKERLARDMSLGRGETLVSPAQLMGVKDQDKALFYRATKDNFDRIYSSDMASTQEIMNGLRAVLAADQTLSVYTAAI